jgi:hypothetical protein
VAIKRLTLLYSPLLSCEGFVWTEIKQMWDGGFHDYMNDWWNLMDFIMNALYLATISLKIVAFAKVSLGELVTRNQVRMMGYQFDDIYHR